MIPERAWDAFLTLVALTLSDLDSLPAGRVLTEAFFERMRRYADELPRIFPDLLLQEEEAISELVELVVRVFEGLQQDEEA